MNNTHQFYITPSDMLEYLYCPRFIYFENVLDIPENQGSRWKVQKGRSIHKKKAAQNPDYLRKKRGVTDKQTEVKLHSDNLGVRGIVDEILTLDDGTMAPLDYKYAEYKGRIYQTYKYQTAIYGLLIEENYGKPVKTGYLVYTRSKNKLLDVPITDTLKAHAKETISSIRTVIRDGWFPQSTKYKKRCIDCCYHGICVQ
ncbi:MAG: CRISPR-associated protein Cas4 [Candidatus Marinimicrobia bacterium]|nr:CRISPR-associated protein Cas4 [Candidatus Neomarinimicrobiota bacterium]MCF7828057.1 CRISPR-associated protein Cas4 [Candidatus Neomarinimicrobiota bacterium]MCF7879188.1 CRISPR-associated protein Cas4 [Candidatus Neomarinimicrobiota bacterium]